MLFAFTRWAAPVEVAFAAVVLGTWWFYRRSANIKLHLLFLALGVLLPLCHLPMFFGNQVLVDDRHFEWNAGNTVGSISYVDVKEVIRRMSVNADGKVSDHELTFVMADGRGQTLGPGVVTHIVMEQAVPEILLRARRAGIPVQEHKQRSP